MHFLSEKIVTAKKHYECDASRVFLQSGYGENELSADDWLIVQGCEADKWKIKPAQKYRKTVYVDMGKIWTFRARLDMDSICVRYEMYDDC